MVKIKDQVVQEDDPDEFDDSTLHKPLFNVNMRLFRTSPSFRQIIMDCVWYMESHLNMVFEDHAMPRGISGAELGIPWNIIAYKHGQKKKFCINPRIVRRSQETVEVETKCGALKLDKGIKVVRHLSVDLEYYNLKGEKMLEKNISRNEGGFTVQHEVDHNYGICVRKREVK